MITLVDFLGFLGGQLKYLPVMLVWIIFSNNLNFIYFYILIAFAGILGRCKIMMVIMGILKFFLNFNKILLISPSSYIVCN